MNKKVIGKPIDFGDVQIDILSKEEREHWCTKLSCTTSDLIIAEHQVGPAITAIHKYLSK